MVGETKLRGFRGRTYKISDDVDPAENLAFLDELKRRLSARGVTRTEITGYATGGARKGHWRGAQYSWRKSTWHSDAY